MLAERADAVAGAKEQEVRADHLVEQTAQVCLDPPLYRRLEALRVGVVERLAAGHDPGPIAQVDSYSWPGAIAPGPRLVLDDGKRQLTDVACVGQRFLLWVKFVRIAAKNHR